MARLRHSRVVRRLLTDRPALVALVLLALISLVAVFHSLLEPHDPLRQELSHINAGPGSEHLLGTDYLGRDVLSRLIEGTAPTLWTAVLGTLIGMIGIPLGLLGGYLRGVVDGVLGQVSDGLLSIPPLLFAFGIIGFMGRSSLNTALAVGIVLIPRFYRVAQTAARSVAEELYMEAARASGCGPGRLLVRHVVPNALGPLLVQTSQAIGVVVSVQAGLSVLGLGTPPPTPTWGGMLSDAFDNNADQIFPMLPSAVLIVVLILCFFTLGDSIRDAYGRAERGKK
ncbi:hypothetical protein WN71_025860 [Streptomyces mangrovisoli]|uniref:ABC transmembrane type-1 domain-containing protein n=1 Tax=Streptomyces mangrovisoli TaxID=1428628 RepID=A0A1J4NSF7_9ACTN|nr:hypothetical protein WN71_025860 [Streptomyces mangrovisoli]